MSDNDPLVPHFPGEWQGKVAPIREWMVEDCFVRGTVGLVSGDGGIGKSLLMQQLACCVALGRPWLGLRVEPARVLYLACEDDADELWRRQEAIARSLACDMDELSEAGLMLTPRVGEDNALMRLNRQSWQMQPTKWMNEICVFCTRFGIQLIIIDTATQTFSGNQNDEMQVVQFINALRKLAQAVDGLVVLTKHPSMTGRNNGTGESGNVAWNNSVRSRFYLHKDKSENLLFECKKSNYGKKVTLKLRWSMGVYELEEPVIAMPYAD